MDKVKKIDEDTANKTFYRYLYDINSDDMSFTAVISDGIQLSVADIFEKADRIADVLTQKGLKAGDSVAEFFLDKFSLLCITLACSKIGVQLIVAHPSLDLKILDNMKEGKNVKMIFCSEARYPFLTSVNVSEIVVLPMTKDCVDDWKNIPVPKGKKVESWNEFLDTETSVEAAEITDNEYPLMALFSTGTTGIPKTIVHTNKSLVAVIFVLSELDMGWKKGDVLLGYPPPFVFTGLIFPVFVPMAMKITLVCDSSNNDLRLSPNGKGVKEQFNFKSVLVYKPNILVVTKSFLLSMITQHNGISLDLSSVKYIVLAGEPLNPQESLIIKNFFKAHGSDVTIENFYGMSEIGGIAYHIEDNSSVLANT
ncbi:MAG: AMP-binding protein, partial [Oscillospiraceae bacterium]